MQRGESREARDAWAKSMLRSDAGFTTFRDIYNNPKTRPKAEKILNEGYPDLKDEILERLAS
jgi:hypothetical protein